MAECVMLCNMMLCNVMLCNVMLCNVMLCNVMLCNAPGLDIIKGDGDSVCIVKAAATVNL